MLHHVYKCILVSLQPWLLRKFAATINPNGLVRLLHCYRSNAVATHTTLRSW